MKTSKEKKEIKNKTNLKFEDISSERGRRYTFPNGKRVSIRRPLQLNVSCSNGHRIISKGLFGRRNSWYIKPSESWYIKWRTPKGEPSFVK